MLEHPIQSKRLRILIISRLLIGASLLFYAQYVFSMEKLVFYAIIALISLLSMIYLMWLLSGERLRLLGYFQIWSDLILISFLIYFTGGVDSLFAGLYVLPILSAGLVLSPKTSFYVAGGSSLCLIATALLIFFQWVPKPFPFPNPVFGAKLDLVYLFYALYFLITVFFLVATLTFYFSRMIQQLETKVKMQERLVLLGEVTSNIAHEIRNPLASISGSVEVISRQLDSKVTGRQRKLMDAVVDESYRINRIFSGLLDYARTPELHHAEIKLEPFLDEIFLLFQHHDAFNPNVEIKTLYRDGDLRITADPEQMKQVFMNIVTNAFEAMPKGGSLAVECSKHHGEVITSIRDTGKGMGPKTLKSLFVPFKTTKTHGTGLGLAQVYKIVSQHNGRVSVRSKKGHGTVVEIALPEAA